MIYWLLLLFGFSIISCTGKVEKSEMLPVETVLNVSDAQRKEFRYTELFDSIRIIPLDTVGDFLLSDAVNVQFEQGRIFVRDRGNRIFIFDESGKGLAKIDKKGQGANEYLQIEGFDISASDSTICLYVYPSRLMYWDFNGNWVKETKVPFGGEDMALLGDDKAVIFVDNERTTQEKRMPQLEVLDLVDGTSEGYFPGYSFYAGGNVTVYQQRRFFTRTPSGECLFVHPLSNDILSVSGSEVKVKYRLDFGAQNPRPELKEGFVQPGVLFSYIEKEFPVYGFNSYWENDRWFSLNMYINEKMTDLLYDKRKGVLYNCGIIDDDITDTMVFPVKAENDYLICYLNANNILMQEDYLQSKGKSKKGNPVYADLLDAAQKFENPIICLLYFKK